MQPLWQWYNVLLIIQLNFATHSTLQMDLLPIISNSFFLKQQLNYKTWKSKSELRKQI
jgi:hypothetical protein